MCKSIKVVLLIGLIFCANVVAVSAEQKNSRQITAEQYMDKMKAGWVGQMAGVGWGWPTEFKFRGKIVPENKVPKWKPETINQFDQDDIYVEMTFLRTLEMYGFDVSIRQAGIDFANSSYRLWHANRAGRDNLRISIAPPDSGHPKYNKHADDIDYQIEADFSGLIAPGLPNTVIALGEKFGRLMNYGDGIYGGQFVGAMYAEAFFENDIEKIILAGLACIPQGSQYHECITDVLKWYKENPDDWKKTWQLVNEKYQKNPKYRQFSCNGPKGDFNIDAKINGAYIVIGLLYGQGDPDKTIIVSMRCGQDSDCNPSSAAGILFTTIGYSKLPECFKSALGTETKFSYTQYNFPALIDVCEKLAKKTIQRAGGRIEKNADGEDVFVIPITEPKPGKLEQSWQPGPVTGSRFTEQQLKKIISKPESSALPSTAVFPEIDGNWWQVAGNPDLGELTRERQQPVDFAVWQATDGSWQLWSCIRSTKCGGHTRLFYRWEGKNLTDPNWKPMGIAMQADTTLGEQKGGLQAPYVTKIDDVYNMFYGDWKRICLAKSKDGKNFTRIVNEKGHPDLFGGPYENSRDAMVIFANKRYHCYYTDHFKEENIGATFCRKSVDLQSWQGPIMVAAGGQAGQTKWSAECPHVVYLQDLKLYYFFRTQKYGEKNITSVYASPDPLNFGVNDDSYFVCTLPVAAPEIIKHNNQYYIAALMPNLQGIRIAKLKWAGLH